MKGILDGNSKLMELISNNRWTGWWSCTTHQSRNALFSKTAGDVTCCVAQQRDLQGVFLARKAMMSCGIALNLNGIWEESQLSPELQNIINEYCENSSTTRVGCSSHVEGEMDNVGSKVK